jgi:hypothetical protein
MGLESRCAELLSENATGKQCGAEILFIVVGRRKAAPWKWLALRVPNVRQTLPSHHDIIVSWYPDIHLMSVSCRNIGANQCQHLVLLHCGEPGFTGLSDQIRFPSSSMAHVIPIIQR